MEMEKWQWAGSARDKRVSPRSLPSHCMHLNVRADFKSFINNLRRAHRIIPLLQGTQAWYPSVQKDTCADEESFSTGTFPLFIFSLYSQI